MLKHLDPFRIVCAAGPPGYLPVVADSYLIGMGKYELTTKEDSINKKKNCCSRKKISESQGKVYAGMGGVV